MISSSSSDRETSDDMNQNPASSIPVPARPEAAPMAGFTVGAGVEGAVLRLTLKRKWFEMIASGEKREEYREAKPWILSRVEGRNYGFVEFRNGYAPCSPIVRCEYLGWDWGYGRREWGGGNTPGQPFVVIKLGKVVYLETFK